MEVTLVYLLLVSLTLASCRTYYDSFKVYQVTPKSMEEAKLLQELENNENYDFWSDLRTLHSPVNIMVSPDAQYEFENLLDTYQIDNSVLISNVEGTIQTESLKLRYSPRVTSGQVSFEEFMRYDDIVAYLERLAQDYPNIVTTEVVGRSFEGRDILLIRISSGGTNKTTIFAEATVHAREWIAPPVALYVINQLVENPNNSYMYQDIDWAIIPVANPDGYEFSHKDTRLWRKTRTPGTICHGTDPNRNFDFNWRVIGASHWQCDQTYAGRMPFSEPETIAIRDYTLKHKDDIKLYLAIHSYGLWLLYPWGHTTDEPDNTAELNELGQLYADAIYAINGTTYRIGSTANLLYYAAGTSIDWAKGVAGIDLAYTLELPGGGTYGFDIDASRIQPVVEETWEGFVAFHDYIYSKFVNVTFFKVYQVTPKSMEEASVLKELENDENFDFWTDLRALNTPFNVMVSPDAQNKFEDLVKSYQIDYSVLINNVEETIQTENLKVRNTVRVTTGEVTFNDFMRYDEIVAYLKRLEQDYPAIVTTEIIGKSFEGRDIYLIRISSGGGSNKTTIFAEAAVHAREWIAPPVALYVINQLVENTDNSYMYQDIDWAIIPVANPDGYEFTHDDKPENFKPIGGDSQWPLPTEQAFVSNGDRAEPYLIVFWRKTRTPGTICFGTDPNRNFDFNWRVIGASAWQCDQNYAGFTPFSEPETMAIRDYTLRYKDDIKLYLAIHSQGLWLLYPWGHTTDEPDNTDELNELGQQYADAVSAVNGTEYRVGSTANLLYYAAGTSIDWAKGVAGIDLAYTIELPGGGTYGWDIDASRIQSVVEETWEGFEIFHDYVYQVTPKSIEEASVLKELENDENFDFWTDLRALNTPFSVMVSPDAQNKFEDLVKSYQIDYSVLINNVEETIQTENLKVRNTVRVTTGEVTFNDFMRYDEIVAYLKRLEQDYPAIVTTEIIGKSFEGRDIYLIRISSGGGSNKTTIFAEAAVHAREWIAPPVALYVINQLVENTNNSYMYQDIDWAIIPVANPDGYEFTHDDNRLWRKTRTPGTICFGTDPNRNFDFNWRVIGASAWQCDQTYAGFTPFSEPETMAIRDYILRYKDDIKLHLAIHSQGLWLLYPWGHTTDEPDNADELNELGQQYADAVSAVNGTEYRVGSVANLLYYAAGSSIDWAKGVAGIDLAYTIELPGGGTYGWDIDASRIQSVVEETWKGFEIFHDYLYNKFINGTL
ncbi:hypothetical protein NQ317_008291 [Molorchus minor]|uniref:Peptidase M14 domain-containing protein n=1 Tax=Molorchus minor TaxID=1323400 RepID=A0ABQ9J2D1_9CUCU|nr:hypothetical protein NQ317_008291 [Molorchus minor]